jgi:hypothetical protein
MPLLRYFTYVGGALVALLFVASYLFPEAPTVPAHDAVRPVIRIVSDRVGPPRVDFDTRLQLPPVTSALSIMPLRAPSREAMAQLAPPHAAVADAPSAAPIKSEPKIEHKKSKIARRPDRQLIGAYPHFAAYPPAFQPFRWMW